MGFFRMIFGTFTVDFNLEFDHYQNQILSDENMTEIAFPNWRN